MRLDMRPFRKSTSFTFVNSHILYEEDPATFYEVFDETFKLIEQGIPGAQSLWSRIRSVKLGRHSEPCNRASIVVS